MRLWIARDTSNDLHLFKNKPNPEVWGSWKGWRGNKYEYFYLGKDFFPEVTWENSPQEVELKLCHQTETIKIADCNPKAQPCVLTNHGIDTNVVKFD